MLHALLVAAAVVAGPADPSPGPLPPTLRLPDAVQGSSRALAQTVERVGQCVARREAQQASIHAFLDGRGAASR